MKNIVFVVFFIFWWALATLGALYVRIITYYPSGMIVDELLLNLDYWLSPTLLRTLALLLFWVPVPHVVYLVFIAKRQDFIATVTVFIRWFQLLVGVVAIGLISVTFNALAFNDRVREPEEEFWNVVIKKEDTITASLLLAHSR